MSELLQSGHHPDADQLSAFVEQALPMHEREQMLAHLAVCPECRETVALSLPDTDESPHIRIVYVRKAWFASWNLLWPATATACAAMAIFGFYIHNAAPVRNESTSTTQMAESQRPSLPAPAEHPAAALKPPVQQSQSLRARQSEDFKNEPKSTDALKAKEETREKDIASISAADRSILMSEKSLAAAPTQEPAGTQRQSPTETGAARGLSVTGANAAKLAPTNQTMAAPPAPAAMRSGIAGMVASGGALAPVAAQPASILLPSGFPVLSMATHEKQRLAIDSHNSVYLSQDAGQHWIKIPARWKSRPVSATLVAYGVPRSLERDSAENGTIAAFAKNEPSAAAAPGPSLTGTVTDTSGAAISGASLEIDDGAGHGVRTVTTNTDGRYLIDGLVPGTYRIQALARGFQSQVLAAVPVSANQQNVTNISLTVGAASETVTVDAQSVSMDELQTAKKQKKKPAADKQSTPVFEILTENGDHWTSPDGVTWKRK